MNLQYLGFGLYLAAIFAIGIYFFFRTKSMGDFILGGRTLGAFPSALSSVASDFSGWLLLGLPAFALTGGTGAFWIAFGLLLGTTANWIFIAPKLREQSEQLDALTVPTFLERKLKDPTGFLRVVLSLAILFFFAFYTSSGFVAGAKLFNAVFGLNYQTAVIVGAVFVLVYTFLGGYLAVSWTDVIQGLLMLAALLIIPVAAALSLGGFGETFSRLRELSPDHFSLGLNPDGTSITILGILSLMAWGLGYFGQPHILARFMGIASVEKTGPARIIAIAWTAVAMGMALLVGYVGLVFFQNAPLADAEQVFLELIKALSQPWIAGFLLAAVMAAIMSTADSQLLVASSALAGDLLGKNLSPGLSLKISRATVVAIAIIAAVLALDENSTVLGIVSYAWAGLGASIGSVLLMSLVWPRTSFVGGIAGVIVGGVVTVVWNQASGGIFALYELLPAFLAACIAIVIGSLTNPNPSEESV